MLTKIKSNIQKPKQTYLISDKLNLPCTCLYVPLLKVRLETQTQSPQLNLFLDVGDVQIHHSSQMTRIRHRLFINIKDPLILQTIFNILLFRVTDQTYKVYKAKMGLSPLFIRRTEQLLMKWPFKSFFVTDLVYYRTCSETLQNCADVFANSAFICLVPVPD